MHLLRLVVSPMFLLVLTTASASDSPSGEETPLASLPYTPGLDVNAMDRTANPCEDFYRYACGGWMRNNPIPADQASWSVFGKLQQDNQRYLWAILAELAKANAGRSADQQKIGDYFAACVDESAIEQAGGGPLKQALARIDALQSRRELPATLAYLHLVTPSEPFFEFGANQDFSDSSQVIAFAEAGGLGLPDRDYYTDNSPRMKEVRGKYVAHIERMLVLLGESPFDARRHAAAVMRLETRLAKASLTKVEKRDPYKLFHKMNRARLSILTPGFDWQPYLAGLGIQGLDTFNVTEPKYFRELAQVWQAASLSDIRTYLRWHLIRGAAPLLSRSFADESFAFYRKTLRGVPQERPRWKRCVSLVDSQLGEALGREFVDRTFSAEMKQRALTMTKQIEEAMRSDIQSLSWMTPKTKARAIEKLDTVVNKIGYPDRWRDYSSVEIQRDDFYGNAERARVFEAKRQLAKIGRPLDRTEWLMTPPSVNAYYDSQMNDINFPAGVLQPPLFDPRMDDAPNYGNTGGTIGHELTHGFDDEGRQFDAKGNLKDWWTKDDAKAFDERAQCIVKQYAQYPIVDEIKINSKLTLGEDIADLGGLVLAYAAWKVQVAGQTLEPRDGLTAEQRFFIGYSQWACESDRPENLRVSAKTDPHSPGKYRVNGPMVNFPEWQKAFSCKAGQPMVSATPCRVW
jgi:putative endopeptidase